MSCTVAAAISNSPVFSPSSRGISTSFFCKTSAATSPETLKKNPSSSPSSPLRVLRIQKPSALPSGLIRASVDSLGSDSDLTSPTVLKRKRPTRLDIPIVSMEFGNNPATHFGRSAREGEIIEVEGDGYAVYCKKGRREAMEDRYSALVDLQGESKQACFGIFDGHGGAKAAEFAAKNLNQNIIDEIEKRDDIEEAVKTAYLKTDSEFLKEDQWGGSCSVTALIRKGNIVVSNAGDCRAVVSREGVAEALTSDHRPSREDEKDRIEATGGCVYCNNGVWRVHGSLAVSRGIGDHYLKQWVIAEPETRILELNPELEFLILASDGLWDKVSNQEAIDIVRPMCTDVNKPQPLSACKKLVDLSASRGSSDDISVMLIHLGRFL